MDCPSCKNSIDDDSFFCDQCGSELYTCPKPRCAKLGKAGKACSDHGLKLVSVKDASPGGTVSLQPAAAAATSPSTSAAASLAAAPAAPRAPSAATARRLRLHSPEHGIDIRPAAGDVLGRVNGPHVGVLSRFAQVSSSHLEIGQAGDGGWWAKDLKAFNHSYYNGRLMQPGQAQPLATGATLSLADISLQVVFE